MRLIAIRLPKSVDGLDANLVSLFDEATAKYESRDYRAAIGLCRDIRNLIEKALGATQADPVATIVAHERGASTTDPPAAFLEGAWKLLAIATNDARHIQGIDAYAAADARAVLLFTAVLVEYLAPASPGERVGKRRRGYESAPPVVGLSPGSRAPPRLRGLGGGRHRRVSLLVS